MQKKDSLKSQYPALKYAWYFDFTENSTNLKSTWFQLRGQDFGFLGLHRGAERVGCGEEVWKFLII